MSRWIVKRRTHADLFEHLLSVRQLTKEQLNPDFHRNLHDPNLLPDMAKARALIVQAKKQKWFVVVFGDYDADGTPAAALLSILLKKLEINHEIILPTRREGYGVSDHHVELIAQKAQLLITVDTGITAVEQVAKLNKAKVKTIILDHHLPGSKLPEADAIVDPFVEKSKYPFNHLCGCALAYKFVEALAADFPEIISESFRKWLLDLVAISTVADMMYLLGENRDLVHYGLKVLQKNRRVGLKALLEQAGLKAEKLTVGSLGFAIGPRLNASGRLDTSMPVFELLTTNNPQKAATLARQIEVANRERQTLVEKMEVEAEGLIWKQNERTDKLVAILGEDWPTGMVGLVAGKLSERHSRPAIVGSLIDGTIVASGRSGGRYALIDGLSASESYLKRYGGHKQAAGMSLSPDNWVAFVNKIKTHAASMLTEADIQPTFKVDAILRENDIDLNVATELERLEPYGLGNPRPLFVLKDVKIENLKKLGDGTHHRMEIIQDGWKLNGIWFRSTGKVDGIEGKITNLLGHLQVNHYRDDDSLQFQIVDHSVDSSIIETEDEE